MKMFNKAKGLVTALKPPRTPEEIEQEEMEKDNQIINSIFFHIKQITPNETPSNTPKLLTHLTTLLELLRTSNLTPKNYNELYDPIYDIIQCAELYIKKEYLFNPNVLSSLSRQIDQSTHLIPRAYLTIMLNGIYMEINSNLVHEKLLEINNIIKQVQHPLRGLFLRNFIIKVVKNNLPQNDNMITAAFNFDDTIDYLLNLLDEMNKMWIRIGTNILTTYNKKDKEKARNDIKHIVGYSIVIISNLEKLNFDLYKNKILPTVANLMLNSNDYISQRYLMECLIENFPNSFNLKCLNEILKTIDQLLTDVNAVKLIQLLMTQLSKGDIEKNERFHQVKSYKNIFGTFKNYINQLVAESIKPKNKIFKNSFIESMENLLELMNSFMKFTCKCCPIENDERLDIINFIYESTISIVNALNEDLVSSHIKIIGKIIASSIDSDICFLKYYKLKELIVYLDSDSRTNVAEAILDFISKNCDLVKKEMSNRENLLLILNYIMPKIQDSNEKIYDKFQFEYEQNIISRFSFLINIQNPNELYSMFVELNNAFYNSGPRKRFYSLQSLANAILVLCYELINYKKNNNNKGTIYNLSFDEFNSDEKCCEFLNSCYVLFKQVVLPFQTDKPFIAIKLYLCAAGQMSIIDFNKEKFIDNSYSFIKSTINLIGELKGEDKVKEQLIGLIIGTIIKIRTLPIEKLKGDINTLCEKSSINNCLNNGEKKEWIIDVNYHYKIVAKLIIVKCIIFKDYKYANETLDNIVNNKKMKINYLFSVDNLVTLIYVLNQIIWIVERIMGSLKEGEEGINVDSVNRLIGKIERGLKKLKGEETVESDSDSEEEEEKKEEAIAIKEENKEGEGKEEAKDEHIIEENAQENKDDNKEEANTLNDNKINENNNGDVKEEVKEQNSDFVVVESNNTGLGDGKDILDGDKKEGDNNFCVIDTPITKKKEKIKVEIDKKELEKAEIYYKNTIDCIKSRAGNGNCNIFYSKIIINE